MYVIDTHDVILHGENPIICFSPNTNPLTVAMVHTGYLKFATERNIVPKGKRGSKNRPKKKPGNSWLRLNHLRLHRLI
jgi:hypothetical protein